MNSDVGDAGIAGSAGGTSEPEPVVLYDEVDTVAFVTLNRPERMNTLTESVIAGVADGIDRATASRNVRSIVLRGNGPTLTAGYDLNPGGGTPTASGQTSSGGTHDELYDSWGSPYSAPGPKPREGAWDPVRDWQFMGHNVKRFMKIWECPKPVLGQIHGWAIGGATDMILCCDLLFMADDAHIGYAPSRIYGTPTTMMWVYRLGLEHAKQFLLSGDAIDAETAHRIGLVAYVHPPEELGERVEAFARRLAHIPANQLALNKLLVNQAFENMGLRTSQLLGTFFDGVTRHTEEAYRWVEGFETKGFRQVIAERDAPHSDYGERPR